MTRTEKMIARAIIKAQAASDSGKGIDELNARGLRGAHHMGYDVKVQYIRRAVELIMGTGKSMFHTYTTDNCSPTGFISMITYFDFKINDIRYQISFHTPHSGMYETDKDIIKLMSFIGKGRPTRWDGNIGGSRYASQVLSDYLTTGHAPTR